MRLILFVFLQSIIFQSAYPAVHKIQNESDSAYIFAYATVKDDNHNGLHFAWSLDKESWHVVGAEHSFVRCDYGRWGSEKKMFSPYLLRSADGFWHCVWSLNNKDGAFAYVSSPDLVYWGRQSYPVVKPEDNCLMPTINYDNANKTYSVTWLSNNTGKEQYYLVNTKDFKTYSPTKQAKKADVDRQKLLIGGEEQTGTIHKVEWSIIDGLIKAQQLAVYKGQQWGERAYIEPDRFKEPVTVSITWEPQRKKKISDLLIGIFFEDINYAADGGLYAELVQNRDFEYHPDDKEGRDKNWNSYKAWSLTDGNTQLHIDTIEPIHFNNKHYAVLNMKGIGAGLINEGFDGIPIKSGEKYNFSVFARSPESRKGKLIVRLIGKNGEVYGEAVTSSITKEWKKYETVITVSNTVSDARIIVIPQQTGRVDLDMVSLFPQKTFKGRKNGLREDLAQVIADMKPRFVRFPGGCVAHGDGIKNIYRWENTIGELEARKPQRNLWGYHQTAGLGYFEYFQFCEDISAEPVPVVAAGVPCQNSAHHGCPAGGQQGGIPMAEMDDYIQSILNLIEYANGDAKTVWGKKRADAGHPKPFNLKYIGVGNEDLITDVFEERFTLIYNAIKERYPEITVIGTVGPFCEGTDYVEGWKLANKLNLPMVDEHYYQSPGWYLNNQDYYDRYDRSGSQVYLGEYAAHIPGRHNNIETALCEALHLANVERNGDIVTMTSYAPLFAKEGYTQWNPDLIYFNNTEVKPTVGYYVQKLYGQHAGDEYILAKIAVSDTRKDVQKRIASSIVRDSKTGDIIIKMVNILPVKVKATFNLSGIRLSGKMAQITVLSGNLDDKQAKPEEGKINVGPDFEYEMPEHSFSVIRINAGM